MLAKEMFEKLGYVQELYENKDKPGDNGITYIRKEFQSEYLTRTKGIEFYNNLEKETFIYESLKLNNDVERDGLATSLSVDEIVAIQKQIEELKALKEDKINYGGGNIMKVTLDLVWNGKVDKNNRLMSREELEKALNTEINKEKMKHHLLLVEMSISNTPTGMAEVDMSNTIGYVESFDLDSFTGTIVTTKETCDLSDYQLAFKKMGYAAYENKVMNISNVDIISCYLLNKNTSARIDA